MSHMTCPPKHGMDPNLVGMLVDLSSGRLPNPFRCSLASPWLSISFLEGVWARSQPRIGPWRGCAKGESNQGRRYWTGLDWTVCILTVPVHVCTLFYVVLYGAYEVQVLDLCCNSTILIPSTVPVPYCIYAEYRTKYGVQYCIPLFPCCSTYGTTVSPVLRKY